VERTEGRIEDVEVIEGERRVAGDHRKAEVVPR
jgi:hypothetical protein